MYSNIDDWGQPDTPEWEEMDTEAMESYLRKFNAQWDDPEKIDLDDED